MKNIIRVRLLERALGVYDSMLECHPDFLLKKFPECINQTFPVEYVINPVLRNPLKIEVIYEELEEDDSHSWESPSFHLAKYVFSFDPDTSDWVCASSMDGVLVWE